jgi:pyruvate-formate lyase-activating enzyme
MPLPLYGTVSQKHKVQDAAERRILRLRTPHCPPERDEDAALIRSSVELRLAGGKGFSQAFIIGEDPSGNEDALHAFPRVYRLPEQFGYLGDEDIVGIDPATGAFRVHYRRASAHNSFLVTERCNHYCLMCSQPPRRADDGWILDEIQACIPLISKDTESLGFTGGEPLLNWQRFIKVLAQCRDELPNTALHVLSNGRAFANREVVNAWAGLKHPSLTVGIPVYAAVDHVHDYVVQALGAFDETLLGILKLKDLACHVEVRVVIHAITAKHLVETCRWLARNLPSWITLPSWG